jgi:hypothetical protein
LYGFGDVIVIWLKAGERRAASAAKRSRIGKIIVMVCELVGVELNQAKQNAVRASLGIDGFVVGFTGALYREK